MVKRENTIFHRALIALREGYLLKGFKRNLEQMLFIIFNFKKPILAIKDYYGRVDNKFIIYELRNGKKFKVRAGTDDLHVILEIFQYKVYGNMKKEMDVLVDVGAHIGAFTVWISDKSKKIYAFEPFNENYNLLKDNIKLNNIKNVKLIKKALTSKNGKKHLYLNPVKTTHNSMFRGEEYKNKSTIQGINLHTFMKEYNINKIDFLKMDVEGSEIDIIKSLNNVSAKKIRNGAIEVHSEFFNRNEFMKILSNKGFKTHIKKIQDIVHIKQEH